MAERTGKSLADFIERKRAKEKRNAARESAMLERAPIPFEEFRASEGSDRARSAPISVSKPEYPTSAPSTSKRPKMREKPTRPQKRPDSIAEDAAVSRGNSEALRRVTEGSPTDKYMGGGMVKRGYMGGGVVRVGDVRDNPNRGKTY